MLGFMFLILGLLNVLLFFHEVLTTSVGHRVVMLQSTAVTFHRLGVLLFVLLVACVAVAGTGYPDEGLLLSMGVCMVYMIGVAIGAAWIGVQVSEKLQVFHGKVAQAQDGASNLQDQRPIPHGGNASVRGAIHVQQDQLFAPGELIVSGPHGKHSSQPPAHDSSSGVNRTHSKALQASSASV